MWPYRFDFHKSQWLLENYIPRKFAWSVQLSLLLDMKQLQATRAGRTSCACKLDRDFWTVLLSSCAQTLSKLHFRNFIGFVYITITARQRNKGYLLVLALQVTQLDCARVEKASFTHTWNTESPNLCDLLPC